MSNDRREQRRGGRDGRDTRKKGHTDRRASEPRYNDTDEAKRQLDYIHQLEAKQKKIQQSLGKLSAKKNGVASKERLQEKDREKAQRQITQYGERVALLEKELSSLRQEEEETAKVMEVHRAAMNKSRQNLPAKREKKDTDEEFVRRCFQAIERQVAQFNNQLASGEASSIAEERAILKQIQRVKATRQLIPEFIERNRIYVAAAKAHGRAANALKSKLSFIDTLNAERVELEGELAQLDAQKAGVLAAIAQEGTKLTAEEQKLSDQYKEAADKVREAREALEQNKLAWEESRREKARLLKERRAAERAKKDQQQAEEQRQRKLDRALELKQLVPLASEMATCSKLISFFTDLLPKEEEEEEAPKAAPKETKSMRSRFADEEEEDDWGSFAKKKTKKRGGKKKKPKNNDLVMNMVTLNQLAELKIDAPMSLEEIPACVESVQKKLEEFQAKSKEQKAKIIADIEEQERKIAAGEPLVDPKEEAKEGEEDNKEGDADGKQEEEEEVKEEQAQAEEAKTAE